MGEHASEIELDDPWHISTVLVRSCIGPER
jgi:hypothetical protein